MIRWSFDDFLYTEELSEKFTELAYMIRQSFAYGLLPAEIVIFLVEPVWWFIVNTIL